MAGLDLYDAAAHWQWALDAGAQALRAGRFDLPAQELVSESRRLADERRNAAALLARAAAVEGTKPAPFLPLLPVTPRMLGVPPTTRACLFDLDGVLTDSDARHAAAWAETLDPVLLGAAHASRRPFVPFAPADYAAYLDGRPRIEGIHLFLAGRGLQLPQGEIEAIAHRKAELLEHGLRARGVSARAGAHRYLQAARLASVQRAVVSASTRTLSILQLAGLSQLVEARIDAESIETLGLRSRPAPDLLLAACNELGVEPAETVSLTHSAAGITAARAIGIPAIAVGADDLLSHGPVRVARSLDALLERPLRTAAFPENGTSICG